MAIPPAGFPRKALPLRRIFRIDGAVSTCAISARTPALSCFRRAQAGSRAAAACNSPQTQLCCICNHKFAFRTPGRCGKSRGCWRRMAHPVRKDPSITFPQRRTICAGLPRPLAHWLRAGYAAAIGAVCGPPGNDGTRMSKAAFLSAEELVERWRGAVTLGTLANWRAKGRGPAYMKLGAKVRYPLAQVEAWEAANMKLGDAS
ncbi:hypothetical protein R77591_01800 [Ralstonia mannitolilytica]|uniref:DNA-binding protein n=2 Tax=Ralstonia mannitolilytica TaxID=105219 RepID=A0AAD2ALI9_9RALS|nr:hypothetical protein R77591_01800 [Ralstonia mannitolilytica]CAJ0878768.1 hypothetical protein R77569_03017 [Ralstonia mannitolilytica]